LGRSRIVDDRRIPVTELELATPAHRIRDSYRCTQLALQRRAHVVVVVAHRAAELNAMRHDVLRKPALDGTYRQYAGRSRRDPAGHDALAGENDVRCEHDCIDPFMRTCGV